LGGKYHREEDHPISRRLDVARYGLSIDDVQLFVRTALGGEEITQTIEGVQRYGVIVRYGADWRNSVEKLKRSPLSIPGGGQVPLSAVADISIKTELTKLTPLPEGVVITLSGQYENMVRVRDRLLIVIPITLLLIVFLLYANTRSWTKTGIVLLAVPFSMLGALLLLTVMAAFCGLLPIMFSTGTGSDVMKAIAAPLVGGLFTSFLLELVIYPPVYFLWKKRKLVGI
jgi:Cu/Ag efflux pump CusA